MDLTGEVLTISHPIEPGGGVQPQMVTLPVLEVARWFDDRQTCRLAHEWIAEHPEQVPGAAPGTLPGADDLAHYGCRMYVQETGCCRGVAEGLCVFLEAWDADIWNQIRSWEPFREGLRPRHAGNM